MPQAESGKTVRESICVGRGHLAGALCNFANRRRHPGSELRRSGEEERYRRPKER